MRQRTLIYTTSKKAWFKPFLEDIQKTQEQAKGLVAEVYDIKYLNLKTLPTEIGRDGKRRPSWSWFKENLTTKGYTTIVLHISEKERTKFGIDKNIGGTYQNDRDEVIEYWFCADEGQKAKYYKGKSEFWRRFLHEGSHGFERFLYGNETEITHHYDYDMHAIQDVYKLYDWTEWDKLQAKRDSLLLRLLDLQNKPILPLPEQYWKNVTQEFGAVSSAYPKTKTHIGTDFACPVGTPVRASWKTEIVEASTGKEVGNYAIYKLKGKYVRICHLFAVPKEGVYEKGATIAFTGNTGKTTGPHLHLDVWKVYPNIALLDSREKVFLYLENPLKFIYN